jgi:hypothetical protein
VVNVLVVGVIVGVGVVLLILVGKCRESLCPVGRPTSSRLGGICRRRNTNRTDKRGWFQGLTRDGKWNITAAAGSFRRGGQIVEGLM